MIPSSIVSAMTQGYIRGMACAVLLAVLAIAIGWLVEKHRDRGHEPPAPAMGIAVAILGCIICVLLVLRTTLTSFGVWS